MAVNAKQEIWHEFVLNVDSSKTLFFYILNGNFLHYILLVFHGFVRLIMDYCSLYRYKFFFQKHTVISKDRVSFSNRKRRQRTTEIDK
jgi:hypothetical protein